MHDVARLAGVSQPTVSRVLNQRNTSISISEETRAKVFAAVEALGYRPNMLARGLRTQETQMVAVMVADISNGFYHHIVRGIQDVARSYNYDVMIANSDHVYDNEIHFCEAVTRRPVDGVIMVPIHLTAEDLDGFITRTNTPVAILGSHIHHPLIDVVYGDDALALNQATSWLIHQQKHSRLGFIGVPDDLPPGPRRFHAFESALQEANLTIARQHIIIGDFTLESGRQSAKQLMKAGDLPTAVVVLNDLMAIGAILAFQEAGLRVPDDIAVLGFDDIPEATIVRPRLTTIAQDPLDIGHKLATSLFNRIANPEAPKVVLESPMRFVKRESA